MGCSGSVTSELTFQQVGDKETAVQNQDRTLLAEGLTWPEEMRQGII